MNTVGIWFCKDCKKTSGIALMHLDWDKKCLLCGSSNLIYMGETNPNDPDSERKEKEINKRIEYEKAKK